MTAVMATYLFEIPPGRAPEVQAVLAGLQWQPLKWDPEAEPGTFTPMPQPSPGAEPLNDFVHFMSLTVLPADEQGDDKRAWLVLEVTADGSEATLARRLVDAMPEVWPLLLGALGEDLSSAAERSSWLQGHQQRMGTSLFRQPGLCFVGTPGMSVLRIRAEAELARQVREWLREPGMHRASALDTLGAVRTRAFEDPALKWALFTEPSPLLAARQPSTVIGRVQRLAAAAARDYLWILLPLPLLCGVLARALAHRSLVESVVIGLLLLAAEGLLLAMAAAWGYRLLRAQERADEPLDREPDAAAMDALLALENFREVAQNHLSAQSRLKPGWMRQVSLRLALWTIAEVSQLQSAPGFLGRIGTIHFARWYLLPGTDRLVFLSNYDGSWQSYLEDFIARLRQGLSSVWSNTADFPRTSNLTQGGAADGTRFKRWARRQQLPAPAWFTAYPRLTAASIRTHAAIRHGLASAGTEEQAAQWLSRLGHAGVEAIETDQVPALVFSGLSRLPFAKAYVVRFPDAAAARHVAAACRKEVSYGQLENPTQALVLGFTWAGLKLLGLPEQALNEFPTPFRQGMGDRSRILGDFEGDVREGPVPSRWGLGGDEIHMICIVYADSAARLAELDTKQLALFREHKAQLHERVLESPDDARVPKSEPFGFRDGVSQPVLRGIRNWTADRHAQHLVNPGEIVLGYPDNLGKRPPTPCAGGVDFGRNGSFLVVRELSQDVPGFEAFVDAQARRLLNIGLGAQHPRLAATREWVAARMVGRWKDGSSLVRHPDASPQVPRGQRPDNDFLFGAEDPDGHRCPFGAHIRRANPRDSLEPGSATQLAISNRHRILRRGRPLAPATRGGPGLLFMCLNADIERQFEFLQQTWLLGPGFHGLDNEVDPLLGPGGRDQALTVPGQGGTQRLEPLSRFVRTAGGGYFFLPGRACLDALAPDPAPLAAA